MFFNIFTIIEYTFIGAFFYINFSKKSAKKILLTISIVFLAYCLIDFLLANSYSDDFASGPTSVEAIILIAFSIYYLFEQINDTQAIFVYSKKSFWIVVATIVYLSGTFFLFIFAEKMMVSDVFADQYAYMNSTLYIIKNCIIAIGFAIDDGQTLIGHTSPYDPTLFETLHED